MTELTQPVDYAFPTSCISEHPVRLPIGNYLSNLARQLHIIDALKNHRLEGNASLPLDDHRTIVTEAGDINTQDFGCSRRSMPRLSNRL